MNTMKKWLSSFLGLLYPNLCLACSEHLPTHKEYICITCQYKLPETGFHKEWENPFTERFWGRINLFSGAALYHFTKGGKTQQLIHHLKYNGKREVGIRLGQLYGNYLKEAPAFECSELIIPVPLHPKKIHSRGYNQAAVFAQGLSEGMNIPWSSVLKRNQFTSTQTHKSRLERFDNVSTAFEVKNASMLEGKHLLLVDDVITTGATLEACALQLLKIPGIRLSMATIAIAG